MRSRRIVRLGLGLAIAVVWTAWVLPRVQAVGTDALLSAGVEEVRRQAERYESRGQWAKACELYEQLLSQDRTLAEVKARYQDCLRRSHLTRRHRDLAYQRQVEQLTLARALEVYAEVLAKLQTYYVERRKAELTPLFRQGLEEMRLALADQGFVQEHLGGIRTEAIRSFQERLLTEWGGRPIQKIKDAQELAREAALAAEAALGVRAPFVVLEFVCGACNALDEYTVYLTPGAFKEVLSALRGELVGVGIEVTAEDHRLLISQVYAGSPAEREGLRPGDQLLRIGGRATANLQVEAAQQLLRGEAGTPVEVEILSTASMGPRLLKLSRQAIALPSVSPPRFVGEREAGIGYLQIVAFQETTCQELDSALTDLQGRGLKALILDLRGNPGGLFDEAVHVVERFLPGGVIVSTKGQVRTFNQTYLAHGMSALSVPLVVLVDGDTASAAEMAAGALKENDRATLVGQTTFGKDTLQRVRQLTTLEAGLRISVARFYSPRGQPFRKGVTPHVVVVERAATEMSMDLENDPHVRAAFDVLRALAMTR